MSSSPGQLPQPPIRTPFAGPGATGVSWAWLKWFQGLWTWVISAVAYDVVFSSNAPLQPSGVYYVEAFARAVTMQGNFAGSFGKAPVPPASVQSLTVSKNGTAIGSLSVAPSGAVTFSTLGSMPVVFNAGDVLSLTAPASVDPSMVLCLTFAGAS